MELLIVENIKQCYIIHVLTHRLCFNTVASPGGLAALYFQRVKTRNPPSWLYRLHPSKDLHFVQIRPSKASQPWRSSLWSISWLRESEDLRHTMSPFSLFLSSFSGAQRILGYVRTRRMVAVHPTKSGKRRSIWRRLRIGTALALAFKFGLRRTQTLNWDTATILVFWRPDVNMFGGGGGWRGHPDWILPGSILSFTRQRSAKSYCALLSISCQVSVKLTQIQLKISWNHHANSHRCLQFSNLPRAV